MGEDVDKAVAALVEALVESGVTSIRHITIDPQGNGECPYRVHSADEMLPLAGLATVEEVP